MKILFVNKEKTQFKRQIPKYIQKYSKPYPIKNTYNINIPANIFQTWETKKIPLAMFQAIQTIKKNNPRFKYYLFDDNDCRNFIKKHFNIDILNAYNRLIPGAYKADLWRYCVLYIHGGIYMDVKYYPINNFKLVNLLEKEHWVLDNGGGGIYNALMVCKPRNEILLKAINQIVLNVKNKYYGGGFLDPTGPGLLSTYFTNEEKNYFDMKHIITGHQDYDKFISFNGVNIIHCYPGYFQDRQTFSTKKHYSELWSERKIYL
jgi:mannosyltransferase OCH1-like enzyme